jgi:hypothetical protein
MIAAQRKAITLQKPDLTTMNDSHPSDRLHEISNIEFHSLNRIAKK